MCSPEREAPRKGFGMSSLHSIGCDPKEEKRLCVRWRDRNHEALVCTAGASALYKHPGNHFGHLDVYELGDDCRNSNLLEVGDVCMSESTP